MTLRVKATQGIVWNTIQQGGGQLSSIVIFLLIVRALSPEEVGIVALSLLVIEFTYILVRQGLGTAIIQRDECTSAHVDSAFWINVVFGLILAAACLYFADMLAWLLGEPRLAVVLRALSPLPIIEALAIVPTALLMREMRFKPLALRTLTGTISGGLVGVTLAFSGFGVWSLVCMYLTTALVGAVQLWLAVRWRPHFRFERAASLELARFGIHILGINIVSFVQKRADQLIVGVLLGPAALGYYAAAQRLVKALLRIFANSVNGVAMSALSRLQADPARFRHAFYTAIRLAMLLTAGALINVAVMAAPLLGVLMGPQWTAGSGALRWAAIAGIFQTLLFFNRPAIMAIGKPHHALLLMVVMSVTSIAVVVRASDWGIEGVAIAYAAHSALVLPLWLWVLARDIGVDPLRYLAEVMPSVASALGSGAVVISTLAAMPVGTPSPIRLLIGSLTGAFSYLVLLFLLHRTALMLLIELARDVCRPSRVNITALEG